MDDSLKMNATIVKEEIENIDADLDDPLKMYATTVKEEITVKEEVFEENEIYVDSGISNAPAGKVEVKQEKKSGEETEIATEETLVKRKWKYLRDQFAVELGKIPPAQSGDAAGDTPISKWQYFKLLHFLKDVVKARASTGNLSDVLAIDTVETSLPESPQVEYQMGTIEPRLATEEGALASSSHTQDTPERGDEVMEKQGFTSPSTCPKKKGASKCSKTDDYNQSILDIEGQKIQYLKEKSNRKQDEDDEDLMFFKSLLPHVKRIPAVQKLTFRSRLQELVQQCAYPVLAISPLPDTLGSSSSASAYTPQMSPYSAYTPQMSPYSYVHSPIESQIYATDMTTLPM